MLPQFQRHEEDNLEAAERREQRLMELLRQSNDMQRGVSAQIEALKPDRSANYRMAVTDIQETRTEGTAFAAPSCSEFHGQFLEISRDSASGTSHAGHAQLPDAPAKNTQRVDTPSYRQSRTSERESSHQLHPEIDRNSSFQGPRQKKCQTRQVDLKFDGSGRGMTFESFLFRVDRLQELYGRQQVFREFHLLLAGAATKWYWQLMEDKAEDYDFDYYSPGNETLEIRRAFSTVGSDLMKAKELMERKQGPHAFRDYVSDMHNSHFKLKHKIAEDEFVEFLKDNMNSQMGCFEKNHVNFLC